MRSEPSRNIADALIGPELDGEVATLRGTSARTRPSTSSRCRNPRRAAGRRRRGSRRPAPPFPARPPSRRRRPRARRPRSGTCRRRGGSFVCQTRRSAPRCRPRGAARGRPRTRDSGGASAPPPPATGAPVLHPERGALVEIERLRRGQGAASAMLFAAPDARLCIDPACGPFGAPPSAGETRRFSSSMREELLGAEEHRQELGHALPVGRLPLGVAPDRDGDDRGGVLEERHLRVGEQPVDPVRQKMAFRSSGEIGPIVVPVHAVAVDVAGTCTSPCPIRSRLTPGRSKLCSKHPWIRWVETHGVRRRCTQYDIFVRLLDVFELTVRIAPLISVVMTRVPQFAPVAAPPRLDGPYPSPVRPAIPRVIVPNRASFSFAELSRPIPQGFRESPQPFSGGIQSNRA